MQPDRTFAKLLASHYTALLGAAMRLTRSRSSAEDLVQDTMVRALRFESTFRPDANIKAWLFTILRNTFINGFHRSARERSFAERMQASDEAVSHGVGVSRVEQAVDDIFASNHAHERIAAALAELHDDFRLAVTLADVEGFAYKEIAEMMGCPIGTVMSRIYRGRQLLRTRLAEQAVELGISVEPAPVTKVPTRRPPPRCPSGWAGVRGDVRSAPVQLGLELAA